RQANTLTPLNLISDRALSDGHYAVYAGPQRKGCKEILALQNVSDCRSDDQLDAIASNVLSRLLV
ncbi:MULTISPECIES: hypothetical protein, partial [Enterobacteriaceae]